MFDEVNRIAMLPETSTNAAASSMNKRLEGKFSVIHANDSMLLSKNHDRIKPGEVENSKIKGGRRKQATMSKVEETRELSDDLVPEKKSLSAEIAEWEEMLRKREEEKVIRRKPARATSVTPESLTTTGTPEGLSADIARLKIEAYQQRKAAEATAFAVHPPRRRIRLEGSRLVGDALDESELRRNKGVTGSQSKAVAKHDNRSGDEPEQKEPEQPASEAAKSAGRPKRRRTKVGVAVFAISISFQSCPFRNKERQQRRVLPQQQSKRGRPLRILLRQRRQPQQRRRLPRLIQVDGDRCS